MEFPIPLPVERAILKLGSDISLARRRRLVFACGARAMALDAETGSKPPANPSCFELIFS